MPSIAQLKTVLTSLEAKSQTQTGNDTLVGLWMKIALALEGIAGAATAANDNIDGWMLRAARAAEAKWGGSGAEENANYPGTFKRIVDALELNAGVSTGSLSQRMVTAAANGTINLLQNGTFANGLTGWSAPLGHWSVVGGQAVMDDGSDYWPLGQSVMVPGASYRLNLDLVALSPGGDLGFRNNNGTSFIADLTAVGPQVVNFVATAADFSFGRNVGGTTATIDNVSLVRTA